MEGVNPKATWSHEPVKLKNGRTHVPLTQSAKEGKGRGKGRDGEGGDETKESRKWDDWPSGQVKGNGDPHGTPKEKDEVNKREVSECEGWVWDLDGGWNKESCLLWIDEAKANVKPIYDVSVMEDYKLRITTLTGSSR